VAVDLRTKLAGVEMANPVWLASGTAGYGDELARFFALSKLGAFVTKTITPEPRPGHPPPRTAELPFGMLNAIGLANVGTEAFIGGKMPFLRQAGTRVVVNVAGRKVEEYAYQADRLGTCPGVDMLELNLSCPNVREGGTEFSSDARLAERTVRAAVDRCKIPVIAKLSPNVTDIGEIARGAEAGGAAALSVMNTLVGLAINLWTRRPRLTFGTGGYSGPAVKPVALAMVHKASCAVKIPIVGIGGISSAEDVVEFMLAGATCVQVGTQTFVTPNAAATIVDQLTGLLERLNVKAPCELIGKLEMP
jgi:dihydroorotate dehydrogenase (NAD+) catalytic subunit